MDPVIASGSPAPDFSLPDLHGREQRLADASGRVIVLNFWSAECPWSARADQDLLEASRRWGERVAVWTIAANASEPPGQAAEVAAHRGIPTLLFDAQQRVADLYSAQTTPHLFVIDAAGLLRYQGALDDVTFRKRTPGVAYLRQAVDAVLAGRSPDPAETPPYGCTIVRLV